MYNQYFKTIDQSSTHIQHYEMSYTHTHTHTHTLTHTHTHCFTHTHTHNTHTHTHTHTHTLNSWFIPSGDHWPEGPMVTTWYEGPMVTTWYEPTILVYGPQNNTRLAQAHYGNMHQVVGDSPTSGRLSLVGSNHYGNILADYSSKKATSEHQHTHYTTRTLTLTSYVTPWPKKD